MQTSSVLDAPRSRRIFKILGSGALLAAVAIALAELGNLIH
ncbi:MAG: hypothetical protein ABI361_11020 [Nitrososphaera sp.]|jgi:hypothetical protein